MLNFLWSKLPHFGTTEVITSSTSSATHDGPSNLDSNITSFPDNLFPSRVIMNRVIQDLSVALHVNGNDSMSQSYGTNCMSHMASCIHMLVTVIAFPVPEVYKTPRMSYGCNLASKYLWFTQSISLSQVRENSSNMPFFFWLTDSSAHPKKGKGLPSSSPPPNQNKKKLYTQWHEWFYANYPLAILTNESGWWLVHGSFAKWNKIVKSLRQT